VKDGEHDDSIRIRPEIDAVWKTSGRNSARAVVNHCVDQALLRGECHAPVEFGDKVDTEAGRYAS
jgi:hypothetical protein